MTDFVADRLANAVTTAAAAPAGGIPETAAVRFEMLYVAYRPLLRKIAMRKFGVPPTDADDLVQDVFATYLTNAAAIRDLHPYLIGAICNASRRYRRRDDASPFCDTGDVCGATPADEVVNGVIRNLMVGAALTRLGASCRDTLERFYLHDESAAAIAAARKTSPGYIYRLLNYCRNRARAIYHDMRTGL